MEILYPLTFLDYVNIDGDLHINILNEVVERFSKASFTDVIEPLLRGRSWTNGMDVICLDYADRNDSILRSVIIRIDHFLKAHLLIQFSPVEFIYFMELLTSLQINRHPENSILYKEMLQKLTSIINDYSQSQ